MRGDSVNGGPGLAITRVLGAYDQLTNAAPAAWLGAFEEPPLMSLSTESGRRQERAAHTSEPFFTSAYEKVPSAMGGIGGEFFNTPVTRRRYPDNERGSAIVASSRPMQVAIRRFPGT